MGQKTNGQTSLLLSADFALTGTSFVTVGNLEVPFPKDGEVIVGAAATCYISADDNSCYLRLALDGNKIIGTSLRIRGKVNAYLPYFIVKKITVKKGQTLSMQGSEAGTAGVSSIAGDANVNTNIFYFYT